MRTRLALCLGLAAAACKKDAPPPPSPAPSSSAPLASAPAPSVVAESLPRCRTEGARLALPGDDVVVGDAVVTADALWVGVVRREGTKRLASLVKASLDLASQKVIDVGPSVGDDPPPSPRMARGAIHVAYFGRAPRKLQLAKVDAAAGAVGKTDVTIAQQSDESLAYDIAWPEGDGAPLVAWDEDAPPSTDVSKVPVVGLPDRGIVRVQLAAEGAKSRVASPESSDAESPRLLPRRGGFWLAWLARRPEPREDGGVRAEGPGEHRAFRWVEIVALDAKGEATSPVKRVSPERGRVVSFELARSGNETDLVVLVQDEAARAEGGGERLVRYGVEGEKAEKIEGSELVDAGVGQALAELVPAPSAAPPSRWLSFADVQERTHLLPLAPAVRAAGAATAEPGLDGARVLASGAGDILFAVGPANGEVGGRAGAAAKAGDRVELRRLSCK
ncbi:MAG: hypothetical protein JST00_30050 [Deltaproteobacteria bacterium]|nr:hypothetical protein [Deltaproteobacteria bacterium]